MVLTGSPVLISQLIKELERQKAKHGDLPCIVLTLTHTWPPDLAVTERGGTKVLVLNS